MMKFTIEVGNLAAYAIDDGLRAHMAKLRTTIDTIEKSGIYPDSLWREHDECGEVLDALIDEGWVDLRGEDPPDGT